MAQGFLTPREPLRERIVGWIHPRSPSTATFSPAIGNLARSILARMIPKDQLELRLRYLADLAERTQNTNFTAQRSVSGNRVDTTLYSELRSSTFSFLQSVFGPSHAYTQELATIDGFASAVQTRKITGV